MEKVNQSELADRVLELEKQLETAKTEADTWYKNYSRVEGKYNALKNTIANILSLSE